MAELVEQAAIDAVAERIQARTSRSYQIPVIGTPSNIETPQVFEIMRFEDIDKLPCRVYAIDGSSNHHTFYNGVSIALYRAGYVCYDKGSQVRLASGDDPLLLAQVYTPRNVLVIREEDLGLMYEELLELPCVANFLAFLNASPDDVFAYSKEVITAQVATFLGFAQEVCEWSLIHEITARDDTSAQDIILRDGTLRSLHIKQRYIVELGRHVASKNLRLAAVTKQSPIKIELSYTFTQIDNYLQDNLKGTYNFRNAAKSDKKLCVYFEVPEAVLLGAYGPGSMYARKAIMGGRGCGLFFAARLDYVEKLQNYDWLVVDVNIVHIIPAIDRGDIVRAGEAVGKLMYDLTALTQEHYIFGYPYPLVEAHNAIKVEAAFKDELVARVKESLYRTRRLDHTEIENLFIDIHSRF